MEREPYLGAATERHEFIQELAPRTVHEAIEMLHAEGVEVKETDVYLHPEELKKELADVQLALWTVLFALGINRVDFYEKIVPDKADIVIQRLQDAFILSRGGAMTRDEAYQMIKSLEVSNPEVQK